MNEPRNLPTEDQIIDSMGDTFADAKTVLDMETSRANYWEWRAHVHEGLRANLERRVRALQQMAREFPQLEAWQLMKRFEEMH